MPDRLAGYGTLAPLFYLYPQAPEFGQELYESGIRQLGWNQQKATFVQAIDDPRWFSLVLMLARELGDVTTETRLASVAEREYGENFFGDDPDRFAWQFGIAEPYPRGQLNGLMILSEVGERGAWTKVYRDEYRPQFHLPTLFVSTYAATTATRGQKTRWRVSQLPDAANVEVYCGDSLYKNWRRLDARQIEIDSTVDSHRFRITWKALDDATQPHKKELLLKPCSHIDYSNSGSDRSPSVTRAFAK